MDDIHQTLGMLCLQDSLLLLTDVPVFIQQLAWDINKSRRMSITPVLPMMAQTSL